MARGKALFRKFLHYSRKKVMILLISNFKINMHLLSEITAKKEIELKTSSEKEKMLNNILATEIQQHKNRLSSFDQESFSPRNAKLA